MIDPGTDRVLITGAAGAIGTALRDGLRANRRHLRLTDIRPVQNVTNNEEVIVADRQTLQDARCPSGGLSGGRSWQL